MSVKPAHIILLLIFLLPVGDVHSQPDSTFYNRNAGNIIRKKDKQKKRIEWFNAVKTDSTVKNGEMQRWNEFTNMQQRMLNRQTTTPVANWKCNGPVNQGGRMISYAFNPLNYNEIWAGAATGGLWKSTNNGDNWQAMTDNIPSCAIGAIGINPQNPNVMLIGTGEGYLLATGFKYGIGVLKSADAGLTWSLTNVQIADSLKFACLALQWDPVQTNRVYLASTFGIYISTDAGDNWTLTLPGTASSLVMNPQDPSKLYAAIQDYGSSNGGIYRSIDNGNTWQLMTSGLPASSLIGFTCLTLCDSFPDVVYAGISYPAVSANVGKLQGLYKTTDGGNTWTLMPFQYDFYCYAFPNDDVCQGWYANVIKVSPTTPNVVYAAGIYTYRSTDGGNSWQYWDYAPQQVNYPYVHPDAHQIAIDPLNPNVLYSFNDGGIYRSNNGGVTWYLKNNNLVTTQFYYAASAASNGNVAMGGTQDNGIWVNHHLDTSSNWFQFTYGDGFACAIDHTNENIMYGTELYQSRMRSTDGGSTFTIIDSGLTENNIFITPIALHPTNSSVLFTATDTKIYKSIDSGLTWNAVTNKSYIITFAFDKINPDIMYAANDPALTVSRIYRSMDGGITWTQVTVPGNKITDIETDPFQSGVLYVTRSRFTPGYQVWKSADMGATWINITGDLPAVPANCLVIDPFTPNYYYVGTDLGTYMTIDGGTTWNSFNQGLPFTVVQDMHFQKSDTTLRTGTHGRGFWTTKLAHHVSTHVPGVGCITEFKINPNPVTNYAVITFSNEDGCDVRITVVNQLGQQVAEIFDGTPLNGIQEIMWNRNNKNGANIAAGVYYIVVQSNGAATTHKIVIGN